MTRRKVWTWRSTLGVTHPFASRQHQWWKGRCFRDGFRSTFFCSCRSRDSLRVRSSKFAESDGRVSNGAMLLFRQGLGCLKICERSQVWASPRFETSVQPPADDEMRVVCFFDPCHGGDSSVVGAAAGGACSQNDVCQSSDLAGELLNLSQAFVSERHGDRTRLAKVRQFSVRGC